MLYRDFSMRVPREVTKATAAKLSEAAGLHVRGTVTKKLDILVTTDPLSSSGKAKKARDYGIRILAERAF